MEHRNNIQDIPKDKKILKIFLSPESGMISVSSGASLDPDLSQPPTTSYFLEVYLQINLF